MKTIKTILLTAFVTGILTAAGSVYAAYVFSNGNGSVVNLTPADPEPTQTAVPMQQMTKLGANQQSNVQTASKQVETASVAQTDEQRITALEVRVTALEAKVK